jgi:hypothetical protein
MHISVVLSVRRIFAMLFIAAAMLSFIHGSSFAQACGGRGGQDVNSSGTEFLLVFIQNEASDYVSIPASARYQDVYIASNADIADTVTITCRAFPNWNVRLPLRARGDTVYRLSTDPMIGYPNQDAIVEDYELVDSTVFRVLSNQPITCYGMSNKTFTADAFLALPRNAATTDYIVMAYYSSTIEGSPNNMPSEFAVASFDNNNTVTIIPSATTRTGNPALQPMTFILDSGECVQIQTSPDVPRVDLTGSVVKATKPVVVYGGQARTEIPNGYFYPDGATTSRDHLCEAMPPQSTWGKSFLAKNLGRPLGDLVRVLSSSDLDTVKINGVVWGQPLKQYEWRDTTIPQSDTAALNIFAIETSVPSLVGLYAHTADQTTRLGDPFLAIVPPLDQTFNDLTYFISNDGVNYNLNAQYVIVATELSGVGKVTIDDIPIPAKAFTQIPYTVNGKKWAVSTVAQTPNIHRVKSPNLPVDGVTILAYGWGDVISYGYTAGSLLRPLTGVVKTPSPEIGAIPVKPGGSKQVGPPSIDIRNIMADKIYFDSAKFTYTQNTEHIDVRLKKDIAMETGTIETAEEKVLELATSAPVHEPITGNVRIWYHSRLYTDLWPADVPFTVTPESQAAVGGAAPLALVLESYPNPAAGRATVHFAIPSQAHASVKIYDALGRLVRVVIDGIVNSGDHSVQVSTLGLIPGEYTLELASAELGITVHRKMIVIE